MAIVGELIDPRDVLRKTTTPISAGQAIEISARDDDGRWCAARFASFDDLEDHFRSRSADGPAEPGAWVRGAAVGDTLAGGEVRGPLLVAMHACNRRRGATMERAVANLAAAGERSFAYETGPDSFVIVAARLARSDMGLLRAAVALADLAGLDCTLEITPRTRAFALPKPGARFASGEARAAEDARLAS